MKLRTKIIIMNCIAILIAILMSDVVIWKICYESFMQEAMQTSYAESYKVFAEFRMFVTGLGTDADEAAVRYFFNSRGDDYTICTKREDWEPRKEYYNHTVFPLEVLEKQELKWADSDNEISYFRMDWDDHEILGFYSEVEDEFLLYHIVDISATFDKLGSLAIGMAGVLVLAALVTGIFLSGTLRRAFRPLEQLSDSAKKIARGAYEERADINGQDEVGKLAESFNTMAAAVENHAKKQELFMGNLTHELKTPLTAISGYAETMQRIKLSEEDEAEALDYICKECKRLERLSKKMMGLLELEHSTELELKEFAVQKLFETVKESCDTSAKMRGVSIIIRETEEILIADFDLLCDALMNLVDNAVKASKQDSEVWLYTERVDDQGFYMIVQDYGHGIVPEDQEQILEPFYMADKSRSRKNGGAGLGLALTSLILRKHGMTLTIESEVLHGTKMKIYNLIKS